LDFGFNIQKKTSSFPKKHSKKIMNHPSFPKKTSGFFQKVSEFSMEFSMENSSFCPLVGGFNPSEKYESQLEL
jgi:hypothetical protein